MRDQLTGPPPIVRPAEDDLACLARRAREAHDEAERSGRSSLEAARAAGEALLRARARVPAGRWLEWVASNVWCDERTAQRYMRVAERWQDCQAATSVSAALALLAAPAREGGPDLFAPPATVDIDAAAAEALAALPAEQQLQVLRGNEERVARLASAQRQRDQADARKQRLQAVRRHLDTARRLAEGLGDEAGSLADAIAGVADQAAELEEAG